MSKYQLLSFHMNCNPNYMFGHAIVSGLLANDDESVNTYEKYVAKCKYHGIDRYNEECYNRFYEDCNRFREVPKEFKANRIKVGERIMIWQDNSIMTGYTYLP